MRSSLVPALLVVGCAGHPQPLVLPAPPPPRSAEPVASAIAPPPPASASAEPVVAAPEPHLPVIPGAFLRFGSERLRFQADEPLVRPLDDGRVLALHVSDGMNVKELTTDQILVRMGSCLAVDFHPDQTMVACLRGNRSVDTFLMGDAATTRRSYSLPNVFKPKTRLELMWGTSASKRLQFVAAATLEVEIDNRAFDLDLPSGKATRLPDPPESRFGIGGLTGQPPQPHLPTRWSSPNGSTVATLLSDHRSVRVTHNGTESSPDAAGPDNANLALTSLETVAAWDRDKAVLLHGMTADTLSNGSPITGAAVRVEGEPDLLLGTRDAKRDLHVFRLVKHPNLPGFEADVCYDSKEVPDTVFCRAASPSSASSTGEVIRVDLLTGTTTAALPFASGGPATVHVRADSLLVTTKRGDTHAFSTSNLAPIHPALDAGCKALRAEGLHRQSYPLLIGIAPNGAALFGDGPGQTKGKGRLLIVDNGKARPLAEGFDDRPNLAVLDVDAKLLAVAVGEELHFLEYSTGRRVGKQRPGHTSHLTFGLDGTRAASSHGHTIWVWDPRHPGVAK